MKPAQYLEYYLTRFNCVELNSSFYRLPQKKTIAEWARRTPDAFRFCPKLSRYITHQKRLVDAEAPLAMYFDLFKELKSRLGPVLIQLPPGLTFDRSRVDQFLHVLKEQHHTYRFAMEIRRPS